MIPTASTNRHRVDIQFLRGIAVILVVAFHAWGRNFENGFLGVDIFFVVSGYLITGIILRDLGSDEFSFREFYIRRARRLLPASTVTIGATLALSAVLLSSSQMVQVGAQAVGSLTFLANFVLASQSGYFEVAAESKPLLHMWSLSLEEQFYFVAPAILWLTPRAARIYVLLAGFVMSLCLCIVLVSGPSWLPFTAAGAQKLAFFMLPSRAWELLAGAIAAWVMMRHPTLLIPRWIKYGALAVIFAVCVLGFDTVHPRGGAIVVVCAPCLLLLGQDGWLPAGFGTRLVTTVGDWSYSLYLVHWPLFAFAFIAFGGAPPHWVAVLLVILAFALAWAQYRFIEQPFRKARAGSAMRWSVLAGSTLALGAMAVPALARHPQVVLAPTYGLDLSCDQKLDRWKNMSACRTADDPVIAVWGDSYAMHYMPGLQDASVIQMTRSSCAPIAGIANVSGPATSTWAKSCVEFNESVVSALEAMPSVRVVLMSSPFAQVLTDNGQSLLVDGAVVPWSPLGEERLLRTLERLKAAGKTPILLAPTPNGGFDAGVWNERLLEGRVILGRDGCDIPRQVAQSRGAPIIDKLVRIGQAAGVEVRDPAAVLCRGTVCISRLGPSVLYADDGHLTEAGSRLVSEGLGLLSLEKR